MTDRVQKARDVAAANAGVRAHGIQLLRGAGLGIEEIAIIVRATPRAVREAHRRHDRALVGKSAAHRPDLWAQPAADPWSD